MYVFACVRAPVEPFKTVLFSLRFSSQLGLCHATYGPPCRAGVMCRSVLVKVSCF